MNRNMLVLGIVALLAIGGVAIFLASKNGGNIFNTFQNITNEIVNNSYFTQLIADGVTTKKDLETIAEIRPYGDGFIGISKEPLAWGNALDLAKKTGSAVLEIEDGGAGTRQQLTEWLNTTFASHLDSTLWVRQDAQTRVLDRHDVLSVSTFDSPRKALLQWKPKSGRATADPTVATKDQPFANSLGMKFVPLPGTNSLICIHETRRGDYAQYAAENPSVSSNWKSLFEKGVPVSAEASHPVIGVTWHESNSFCEWLSKREGLKYRITSDREWSIAVGIAEEEDPTTTVEQLSENAKTATQFVWGNEPRPRDYSGNFADSTLHELIPENLYIENFSDGFPTTAPVMSFKPNNFGIFDLGGNAWEWCSDRGDATRINRIMRGASWDNTENSMSRSSFRFMLRPSDGRFGCFRCVIDLSEK